MKEALILLIAFVLLVAANRYKSRLIRFAAYLLVGVSFLSWWSAFNAGR